MLHTWTDINGVVRDTLQSRRHNTVFFGVKRPVIGDVVVDEDGVRYTVVAEYPARQQVKVRDAVKND